MTSSFARESGRFVHPFRRFISGLVAFAMATVGLVGIQVAASQPASAAGNVPVGYVVNQTAGTVTAVNLQSNATVATITVGSAPYAAVVSPDGKKVYVANVGSNNLSRITVATNVVADTYAAPGGPIGIALTPDVAPIAALAAVPSTNVYTQITFDASGSTMAGGAIVSYVWDFGDATAQVTTAVPTTTHTYTVDGTYPASVTVTNSTGTSTTVVFTGQTVSRNGSALAKATQSVTISTPFGFATAPLPFAFSGVTGALTTQWALPVMNGTTAGWNISATSTQWTAIVGGRVRTLPLTALSVPTAPVNVCVATGCLLATNAMTYPYVVPSGVTAPTATKMFNAAPGTGIGSQTVTPTMQLKIPGSAYAGTYTSTVTVSLNSGP
jgi:YVTN family beta-propeller protein